MLSIGIDIGSFSIKMAKVRSTKTGYELVGLAEYPLSQDPSKDNQIEIIEALRDIYTRYFEDGCQLVTGVRQNKVSVRRLKFPFRERHKILKTLPFELEEDIPFSFQNSIFDGRISFFQGAEANVLAFACLKDHVEKSIQPLIDAGKSPDILSVNGVAFASVFEEWRDVPWEYPADLKDLPAASPADVIIDIGHRSTTVAVIKDGYCLDLRHIDWGGKDIADSIASRYSLHPLEAIKDLRRKAYILLQNEGATKDQIALSEVIKASIDGFGQKLQLTLLEMQSLHNLEYRQSILTGGVSQLRNLGPYLTQKIEVASNRLGKLDPLPSLDFSTSPNNELAAVTAIGLALEGLRRPKNPAINLLKEEFARQSQTARLIWEKWGHALQLCAAGFFIFLIWGFTRDTIILSNVEAARTNLNDLAKNIITDGSLGSVRGGSIRKKTITDYIRKQEKRMELKKLIEDLQNINSTLDILKRISTLAPKKNKGGLNVYEFAVNTDKLTIVGEVSDGQFLNELQNALKATAFSGQFKIETPPPARKTNYRSFKFEMTVDRKSGG